jgi:hypothetical protein
MPQQTETGDTPDREIPGVPLDATGGAGDNPKPPITSDIAVDLAAWGRGEREYPFNEVRLAIDEYVLNEIYKIVDTRFVSLKSRVDALQFLIDEGFITSADARGDV